MIRRIGCWTLLIASALWAQGCAHSSQASSLPQAQRMIQGQWKCTFAFNNIKGKQNQDYMAMTASSASVDTFTPTLWTHKGQEKMEITIHNPIHQTGYGRFTSDSHSTYTLQEIDGKLEIWEIIQKSDFKMIENSDNFVGRMLLSSYSKTQKKTQEYIDTQRVKKTSILKLNHKELVLNDIGEFKHEVQRC